MNNGEVKPYTEFVLPPSVVTKLDLSHLVTEIERVDNELTTKEVRQKTGSDDQSSPVFSDQLTGFIQINSLDLNNSNARSEIIKQARLLKDAASVVHMTFATTADRESLQTLAQWYREAVNPHVVISVGMQPGLVAGVYMRTPNHVHDFSLRARLESQRGELRKELESSMTESVAVNG